MFTFPDLPYDYKALEPFIDEATMKLHHDKHHATYVEKLNTALSEYPDLMAKSIEDLLFGAKDLPDQVKGAVTNHGGGHANHTLFWETLKPNGGGEPGGVLADAIKRDFGSFADFKKGLTDKALTVFGSGWAFLILTPEKTLQLKRHSFQNSPLMHGNIPLLGIDVWEHAYYLKYQNRRPEYVEAIWNVVNWEKITENFKKSI